MARPPATKIDAETRFWSKVAIKDADSCWLWLGQVGSRGYGNFSIDSDIQIRAHRLAYMITYGNFNNSLMVLHKCDNPLCCNPSHLFLGTHKDNMEDMSEKGRTFRDRSYITHCPQSHEYTEENTYINNKGARTCLICKRKRARDFQRNKREKEKICQPYTA